MTENLYDILGALPDDDAEGLRAAFRKAAKANHPDNNPGDPDAALRFRRIVRAGLILRDEQQRDAYDQLLETARQQQSAMQKRDIFSSRIGKLAPGAILVAVLSLAFIEAYLVFGYNAKPSLFSAHLIAATKREPVQTAAPLTAERSDITGQTRAFSSGVDSGSPHENAATEELETEFRFNRIGKGSDPRENLEDVRAPEELEIPEPFNEATALMAIAPVQSIDGNADMPAVRDVGTNDARYYRERGLLAYRVGNLYHALANFDLAISLDPGSLSAYIDRGIVFHRMGDLKRAFADVAHAKRIDATNRGKTPAAATEP